LCIYGTDHSRVDVAHATRRGVTVCNTPGYSTGAVAEFVFGVILDHIRGLAPAKSRVRDGRYTELGSPGTEIAGKRFGVVGLGRIGRRVAEIAKHGFGANVHYWSRNRKPDIEQAGIGYADIATLLRSSDFISIHVTHTTTTERLINAERIKQIKPGAVVVHLSPIELIDLDALEQRLKRGDMTIVLDHTDELPAGRIRDLARFGNCVMYPAIACTTQEAKRTKRAMLLKNIEGFLAGYPSNQVTDHG
jgi:lactate dehydrogenase-like 2-hydroxyacid dehydrogenase